MVRSTPKDSRVGCFHKLSQCNQLIVIGFHTFTLITIIGAIMLAIYASVHEAAIFNGVSVTNVTREVDEIEYSVYSVLGIRLFVICIGFYNVKANHSPGLVLLFTVIVSLTSIIFFVVSFSIFLKFSVIIPWVHTFMKQEMESFDLGECVNTTCLTNDIQMKRQCCGVESYKDWQTFPFGVTSLRVPNSCCLPSRRFLNGTFDPYCGQNLLPEHPNPQMLIHSRGCLAVITDTKRTMDCSNKNQTSVTRLSLFDSDKMNKSQELVMRNPVILENIFTFLDISTVKSCRYVSSLWNYFSNQILLNRTRVTIMSDKRQQDCLSNFLDFIEFTSLRFHNYQFISMNLTNDKIDSKIIQFFENYGSQIIRLHLKQCKIDKHGNIWKLLVNNCKLTPNLQEFILESCIFKEYENELSAVENSTSENRIKNLILQSNCKKFKMPCHMSKLFNEFPYLEGLKFVDLTDEENQTWLESVVPTTKSKTVKRQLNITNLDIFCESIYSVRELPLSQLQMLCALKLPLTKLTIDIGENIHLNEFKRLLQVYANSLKSLTIWRGLLANKIEPPGFPFSVDLPRLEDLEVPESIVFSFNFIHKIRQIRRLIVRQCDLNPIPYETDIFSYLYTFEDMRAFVLQPLLDLTELHVQFTLREIDVQFFKGIFPKMRMLSGFINEVYIERLF